MIKVWDIAVRVFHWGLVAAFAVAWLSSEDGETVHELAGYVAAGLIAFRLVWGLIGPRYARWTQFLTTPGAALAYTKDSIAGRAPRYIGHNPAGGLMIVALLVTLSGTAFTGWLMAEGGSASAMLNTLPSLVSPAHAESDGEGDGDGGEGGIAKDLHEVLANLMLLLVALHIGGVVMSSVAHKENLARSMVTGTKRAPGPGDIA